MDQIGELKAPVTMSETIKYGLKFKAIIDKVYSTGYEDGLKAQENLITQLPNHLKPNK